MRSIILHTIAFMVRCYFAAGFVLLFAAKAKEAINGLTANVKGLRPATQPSI
ncbi:MAG: hypothetical protein WCG87_02955 [Bacteroidota bacterium]